ncbi:unnamed protein product [Amaranthus hypochondriacus]
METTYLPKFENHPHEWFYFEDHLHLERLFDQDPFIPPLPSINLDYESNLLSTNFVDEYPNSSYLTYQSQNIDNFSNDFYFWDECPPLCDDAWDPLSQLPPTNFPCMDENFKPFESNNQVLVTNTCFYDDQSLDMIVAEGLTMAKSQARIKEEDEGVKINKEVQNSKANKVESIDFEEIRKYFNMPISMAAKELNVGLTVLKKRCRELNIKRWPHRKIKSLEALITSVKEEGQMEKLNYLEEYKKKLEYVPGLELDESTKKLRQQFFKANYKKRRAFCLNSHMI